MVMAWCRFAAAALCLGTGLAFMVLAVFGVNRFRKALNRMHAAALGDTLGILFIFLGLMIIRGFSLDSLKLLLVILFFWIASPVSGHMISRLEAMTNEHLGEILVIDKINDRQTEKMEEKRNHQTEEMKEKRNRQAEEMKEERTRQTGSGKETEKNEDTGKEERE